MSVFGAYGVGMLVVELRSYEAEALEAALALRVFLGGVSTLFGAGVVRGESDGESSELISIFLASPMREGGALLASVGGQGREGEEKLGVVLACHTPALHHLNRIELRGQMTHTDGRS